MCSNGEPCTSPESKEKEPFFYRGKKKFRGAVVNNESIHWRKLGVQSVVAFPWMSFNSLSLAEWLPSEKILIPDGIAR